MAECSICNTNDDSCIHYHKLRRVRNGLLKDSDKYVLPDIWEAYSAEQKTAVANYRQALRDWPSTVDNPLNLGSKLPTKPSFVADSDTYRTA